MPYTVFNFGDPSLQAPLVSWIPVFDFGDPSPQAPTLVYELLGVSIRGAASIPIWPSFTFAPGVVGQAYLQQFDLAPASAPTTYSVVSGALPPGLTLTSISGDLGSIAGIPTLAGTFSFTLRATNAYGTADQAFAIVIYAVTVESSHTWVC
jgi:hypothetical protein